MKSEKAEHQQAKNGLESKINEEKSKCEKATNEAKLQLSSLQQHYNLLQTQLDDFKSECSKNQQEKSSENNNLQSKLQEIQGQLKKLEGEREKLKSEYAELQAAKQNLEERVKGTQGAHLQSETEVSRLVKENNALKSQLEILKVGGRKSQFLDVTFNSFSEKIQRRHVASAPARFWALKGSRYKHERVKTETKRRWSSVGC